MKKMQIASLFVNNLSIFTVGIGLLPLLPLYAEKLGADPSVVGYYLAFATLALAAGEMTAGWLSDRFQRRKLFMIIAGFLAVLATWMMGQVTGILSLIALTALLWFCGGIGLAMVSILAGLSAGESERGKVFGILSLTGGLGALFGGLSTGYIVDHWGYSTMFSAVAGFCLVWGGTAFLVTEKESTRVEKKSGPAKTPGLGRPFTLLLTAVIIGSITSNVVILLRSLLMNDLGFGATAISSTGAIGGILTLPLPFLAGWLSDRKGRKNFLYVGYLIGAGSVVVLAYSSALWHFWTFILLQSLSGALTGPVGSALATDLLPPQSLGKGLGLYNAGASIGGTLGFALGGFTLKSFGLAPTFLFSICITFLTMLLLVPIRPTARTANQDDPFASIGVQVEPTNPGD